jgi:hypothetical protein
VYLCSGGGDFSVSNGTLTDGSDCRGSIEIPSNVATIGMVAFNGATDLTSVTFATGSQVTYIMPFAFVGAGIESITLPQGLQFIGGEAFASTKLTSVTIPSTVFAIGPKAFRNATLREVVFTGPAPRLDGDVFTENPGAIARGGAGLTGYPPTGAFWQGLIVQHALSEGVTPELRAISASTTGFTVWINNYDPAATYEFQTLPAATTTMADGVITVSDLSANRFVSLSVMVSKEGYTGAQGRINVTTLAEEVPAPILTAPVSTADGFSVRLTNLPPNSDPIVAPTIVPGVSLTPGENGLFTVTGMRPGTQYSFKVAIKLDINGVAAISREVLVTGSPAAPLTAPLFPSAFAQSATSAFVTWGSVIG